MKSWLYVPGNSPDKLLKACFFGADGIVIDLEDSVDPGSKDEARILAARLLTEINFGSVLAAVRINGSASPWWRNDLEALISPMLLRKLSVIRLPKVERTADLHPILSALDALERRLGLASGSLELQCILETPLGVEHAFEIAAASSRIRALCFGAEDYAAALGLMRYGPEHVFDYPRSRIAAASASAGIIALDTVWGRFREREGLEAESRRARSLGFAGKSVIHPDQIDTVNRIFAPSPEELAWAREVVARADAAGTGAAALDGEMIDRPVIERARRILGHAG